MGKEAADEIIVSLVQKYDTEKVQKKGVETIKKILDNILKYPTEQKYRPDYKIYLSFNNFN